MPFLFFWRSSSGAQQGDPLASLLFALVLQPLLLRYNELCPNAFAVSTSGFMMTAQSSAIVPIYNKVWNGAPPGHRPSRPSRTPCTSCRYFWLLPAQCPSRRYSFCPRCRSYRIKKSRIFDLLPYINDAQIEFTLLHQCFSLPILYC